MKKHNMSSFVKNFYGVFLGIGFYRIAISEPKKNQSHWVLVDDWQELFRLEFDYTFFGSEFFFYLLLFVFMLAITAHDWYSYNKEEEDDEKGFWQYLPQLGGLFFLAQMFAAIESHNFKYWLGFSVFYTGFNILNACIAPKQDEFRKKILKYAAHAVLGVIGFVFAFSWKEYTQVYFAILAPIAIGVILIWICEDKKYKEINAEAKKEEEAEAVSARRKAETESERMQTEKEEIEKIHTKIHDSLNEIKTLLENKL